MVYALGVDGGGTQTRCVVIDEHGQVMGFGVSGPSKPDAVEVARGRLNLHQAIIAASQPCGGPGVIDTVFLGIGGIASEADVEVARGMIDGVGLPAAVPVGIDHDVRIALAGGTAGQPGIALIVGTGSSCYGRNAAGESWRSGGWGFIVDDYGSGFYLGQHALMAVIRAYDGRGAATVLTAPILEGLGIGQVSEVMHRIYHPRLDTTGIAALAPIVVRVAENDPVASAIVQRGCDELALMVLTTTRKLNLPENVLVVPVGSLGTANPLYRQVLETAIHRLLPEAQIKKAVVAPVAGAALLALDQIGLTLSPGALAKLAQLS
jgi:N-acetylglucosamine kinase-like BadF-type ATPase